MTLNKMNPATAVQGVSTGSGVLSSAACDLGHIALSPAEIQASFVRRRVRVGSALVPIVAALVFGEVR